MDEEKKKIEKERLKIFKEKFKNDQNNKIGIEETINETKKDLISYTNQIKYYLHTEKVLLRILKKC
jgi:hypothetical protein